MPAIGDIFQLTFQQLWRGQVMENVIHFRARGTAPTDAELKTDAQLWLNFFCNLQSTEVSYPAVKIKRMTPLAFDEIIYTPTGGAVGGTQATPAHNTTLAIVFTKRTGTAGKKHRGRMYVGGYPASWGVDRITDSAGLTAMGTFAGSVLAAFGESGTSVTLCAGIYSRSIGGTLPFTLAGWQAISRWDPQILIGNQRRRREGVGI